MLLNVCMMKPRLIIFLKKLLLNKPTKMKTAKSKSSASGALHGGMKKSNAALNLLPTILNSMPPPLPYCINTAGK